jgi:hypothetical protein
MKIVFTLVIAAMMTTLTAVAESWYVNSGLVVTRLTASAQNLQYAPISTRTNHSSTVTNITTVYKSSVTNFGINSDYLVRLLENSFNTTFESGAKLAMSSGSGFHFFYVADSTGTNILMDLSTNLFIGSMSGEQTQNSGTELATTTLSGTGTTTGGSDVETYTETVLVVYDDTGLTTKDGTHSKFQLNCVLVRKLFLNLATQKIRETVKLQGAGYGTIRDKSVQLEGSMMATLSGLQSPAP